MHPLTLAFDAHAATLDSMAEAMRKAALSQDAAVQMETIDVGQTPASVVYEENKLELLHYESQTDEQCDVPILIVYALINRPYILDLQPDRSVVRRLLEAGHDVYLIDWNEPSRLDAHLDLSDYADRYLDNCVDVVRDRSDRERINLLGYCMGGTFASIYTALYPEKVNALGLMAPALHFDDTGGILEEWGREEYFDPRTVTGAFGVVPAEFLDIGFGMINPVQQYLQKYVDLWDNLDDEEFVANFARMERWLDEGVDMAGGVFEEFVTKLYQENRLTRNELEVGGRPVDLENIDHPLLLVIGEYDHLIPAEASKPVADAVASDDVTTIEYPVGHIGLSVSSSSHEDVWPEVCAWYHDVSGGDG